jgi:hypothetical protein
MSETTAPATHEVVLPVPPESKWRREYQAFLRMLPALLETHRGKYVAVDGGKVVDSDEDEAALTFRVLARNGNQPIHVGLVTDEPPRVERIPTPRVVRDEAAS